jgi:hypothetical protein
MVNLETILFGPITDKQARFVILVTIGFLLTDTMINNASDFLTPQTTSKWGISFFVILSIVFAISQHLILRFVWWKTKDIRSKSFLINALIKVVIASQYTLLAILIVIICQIQFTSQYYTALLNWSTVISYSLTIFLIGILARQFFLWYRSHKRDSFIILSYAVAFAIMSMTFSVALILDIYHLSGKQEIVTPTSKVTWPNYDNAGWLLLSLRFIYNYSDLVSFVLIWGATALLLLHYRRRLGLAKFWIIITLPLIYYLSAFADVTGLYQPQSDLENFYYELYTALNSTAGGLMFAIAFIVIANRIDNQSIKVYMNLAAYGFILLYISSQVTLVGSSYPPFGITTLDIGGLSSFLLLTGLYSTAVSLSKHAELRKSIRNSIEDQHSRLIDRIGMSEVQRDIDRRITPVIQRYAEQIDTQTAIDLTISEEEIKQYIKE